MKALRPLWSTHKERIVHPGIGAVGRGFKLRCSTEIERRISVFVLSTANDAAVAHVDVDAIVGLDAVDGLQFRAIQGRVGQLVVGTAVEDSALQQRPLEGSYVIGMTVRRPCCVSPTE